MKSILQDAPYCRVCRTTLNLHKHHVFEGTGNRKQSEKYGCVYWLCGNHHNLSKYGAHFNKELELELKQEAQKKFEEMYDHETFIKVFGKNYL